MRIALTADPELPVPPLHYGGIERIVDLLAKGLVARGHDVTLFAHPNSDSAGRLIPWPGLVSGSAADTARNAAALAREVRPGKYDIVHSFSRIAYLLPLLPRSIPKLMTYQREVTLRSVQLGTALSRGTLEFCAISRKMIDNAQGKVGRWHIVYNGVSMATYTFVPSVARDAPLVFLGRIEPIKGTHLAVEIAKRSGCRLVIAGNIPGEHRQYFDTEIAPHVDGEAIRYIGPVDDAQKNTLLGSARAFLMPILWEEPFGIVMAEAHACGTPVLGLRRGAVPEVVADGVTGFISENIDGLAAAVSRIDTIDRSACRARAESMFSDASLVESYLAIYRDQIERRGRSRPDSSLGA